MVETVNVYDQIKKYYTSIVPSITENEWAVLQEKFTVQQLKKGDSLVRSGEICRQVSFINKGLVRMFYRVNGKEICTAFMAENEYTSQYDSFLTQQASAGDIDVLEDCECVNLSYNDLQVLYETSPSFEKAGRKIAEMLFIMVAGQTDSLLTQTPEQRYSSLLQHQPYIIQRVPQYMVASFIGITPEHLSRLRKKMSAGKQKAY
jgi:CRP-like cAMP-binding protein